MNWKAVGKGFLFGLKVAGQLVTLGVIHGKAGKIITIIEQTEQAVETAKAEPAHPSEHN